MPGWIERNVTVSTMIQLVALLLTGAALYFGLDKQLALVEQRVKSIEIAVDKIQTRIDTRAGLPYRMTYPTIDSLQDNPPQGGG